MFPSSLPLLSITRFSSPCIAPGIFIEVPDGPLVGRNAEGVALLP